MYQSDAVLKPKFKKPKLAAMQARAEMENVLLRGTQSPLRS